MPQTQTPTYGNMKAWLIDNLKKRESLYFASMVGKGEHGKEGQVNGWLAARQGLREHIGLEGILGNLDVQIAQSIENGGGHNANFNVADVIKNNAEIFEGSVLALKARDLVVYIGEGLEEVRENPTYMDKTVAQLIKRDATQGEKLYGTYLMEQLNNAVMIKGNMTAYAEKARQANEAYDNRNNRRVMIKLPNGTQAPMDA
jgi:hypothetical protein